MAEQSKYSVNNPYNALHFTQVVWKSSKQIGCAWSEAKCPNGWYYFFCEYSPPGNVEGEFAQNVSK